jgi:hypothetical protein
MDVREVHHSDSTSYYSHVRVRAAASLSGNNPRQLLSVHLRTSDTCCATCICCTQDYQQGRWLIVECGSYEHACVWSAMCYELTAIIAWRTNAVWPSYKVMESAWFALCGPCN